MALSGDPRDIDRTDELALELFPDNEILTRWLKLARGRFAFQGLPARICWLGYGERARMGEAINELVRKGEISAPIAMGRDHLDTGSVASPYRETEKMLDGSDAVADWPILNALLNTASGATWVSFHHGGGVGMGYSLHAGQVTVADGTEMAARKIARVLNNDPGLGVARHADAGYELAQQTARERGIRNSHGGEMIVTESLAIVNIGQLVTLAGPARPRVGTELRELGIIPNAALLIEDGRIVAAGPYTRAPVPKFRPTQCVIDAEGRCVTPGFVDAHTHLVFAGNRAAEFEMRIAGASYQQIAAAGGGILSTVRATRAASEDELLAESRRHRDWMLRSGTTTAEAKSGYGLERETELRMLRVMARLNAEGPMRVVPTLLAAHTVPPEFADAPRGVCSLDCRRADPRGRSPQARAFLRRLLRRPRLYGRGSAHCAHRRPRPRHGSAPARRAVSPRHRSRSGR